MTEKPGSQSGLSFFDEPKDGAGKSAETTQAMPAVRPGQAPPAAASTAPSSYSSRPQFALVRRGYDKDSVDAFLSNNANAQAKAAAEAKAAQAELAQLRAKVAELEHQARRAGRPPPTRDSASTRPPCCDSPRSRPRR